MDNKKSSTTSAEPSASTQTEQPDAQAAAQDVAREAQARVQEVGRTVTEQTKEAAEELRQSAVASFDDSKGQLTEQIEGLAKAFRNGSYTLRREELDDFARLSDGVAERLEDLGNHLDRGTGELLSDAQRVAQTRPVLFISGLLTLGIMSARFLRSSEPSSRPSGSRQTDRSSDFRYQDYEKGEQ